MEEAIAEDSTESDFTIKDDMYNAFKRYCKEHRLAVKSNGPFGKDLKKLELKDGREINGEKKNNFMGRCKIKA